MMLYKLVAIILNIQTHQSGAVPDPRFFKTYKECTEAAAETLRDKAKETNLSSESPIMIGLGCFEWKKPGEKI